MDKEQSILRQTNNEVNTVSVLSHTSWYWHHESQRHYRASDYIQALSCIDQALDTINNEDSLQEVNTREYLIHKGEVLFHLQRYDELHTVVDQVLALYKYDLSALKLKSRVYESQGDTEQASIYWKKYIVAKANAASMARCYNHHSFTLLDSILEADERYAEAWHVKGLNYARQCNYSQAVVYYDKAIALEPTKLLYLLNKGYALRELGDYVEAHRVLNTVLEQDKEYAYAWYEKGEVYEAEEVYAKALGCYNKLQEIQEEQSLVGNDFYMCAGYARARMLDRLGLKNSYHWIVDFRCLCKQKLSQSAQDALDTILTFDNQDRRAWYEKALVYEVAGNYYEALSCFDRALEININPDMRWGWWTKSCLIKKCHLLQKMYCYDKAETILQSKLENAPNDASVLHALGLLYYNQGQYFHALPLIKQSVKLSSDESIYLHDLSKILCQLGDYDEAHQILDKILQENVHREQVWNTKALVYIAQTKYFDALVSIEHALKCCPESHVYKANKGFILTRLQRYDEAQDCVIDLLEFIDVETINTEDPNSVEQPWLQQEDNEVCYISHYVMGSILIARAQHSTALPYYQVVMELFPQLMPLRQQCTKHLRLMECRAIALLKLQKITQAEQRFELLCRNYPEEAQYCINEMIVISLYRGDTILAILEDYPGFNRIQLEHDLIQNPAYITKLLDALRHNVTLTTIQFHRDQFVDDKESQATIEEYLAQNQLTDAVDLSRRYLTTAEAGLVSTQLTSTRHLKFIKLARNTFDDFFVKDLVNTLNGLGGTQVELIDISYNQIGSTGPRYVADYLTGCPQLMVLNLAGNRIDLDPQELYQLFQKNNDLSSLKVVNIAGNILPKYSSSDETTRMDYDALFKEQKAIYEATSVYEDAPQEQYYWQYNNLLLTYPVSITSILDETKTISYQQWIIVLACCADKEHALIFIEGIERQGQRRFFSAEIGVDSKFDIKAKVHIKHQTKPSEFIIKVRNDNYYFYPETWLVDGVEGRDLIYHLEREAKHPVPYSYLSSPSSDRVNCLDWCIRKLQRIEHIHVNRSLLPIPSHTVQNRQTCIIQ